MKISFEDIMLWPDGTWCFREELSEMTHMSDDYTIIYYEDEKLWNRFAMNNNLINDKDCLMDIITHLGDWRAACEIARDTFSEFPDPLTGEDDRSYWVKQLKTLDNIEKVLEGVKELRAVKGV